MYESDTILVLKEQREAEPVEGKDDEFIEFPYNRVRVIGPSPISHTGGSSDWDGVNAQGVMLSPMTSFGTTLDEPFGKIRELYDVESVPEPREVAQTTVRVVNAHSAQAGETPEEAFKRDAPGVPPAEGLTRGRTPFTSPLPDPRPSTADASPLTIPKAQPKPKVSK